MMTECALCKSAPPIKNSHIIPKFVFEWLKVTSATGAIRNSISPNKREQDGVKVDLLCRKCESDFSILENAFRRNIFDNIANYRSVRDTVKVSVDDKKCIYSIAWRVLAWSYYYNKLDQFTEDELARVPAFLSILEKAINTGGSTELKTFLIPLTETIIGAADLPDIDFMYYDRSIGMEPRIYDNYERLFLYIKLPFILIVCELISNENDRWMAPQMEVDSLINLNSAYSVPEYVADQINHFYGSFEEAKQKISESQSKRIQEALKSADKESGTFKTIKKNFGDA